MKTAKSTLIILIPAFNEENRITSTLDEYLNSDAISDLVDFKIKVILNGCKDNTFDKVANQIQKFPDKISLIEEKKPIGKGGAIKLGFQDSLDFDYLGYVDADGSTSAAMYARLIQRLLEKPELDGAIASRYIKGSNVYGKAFKRKIMSGSFSSLVNILFFFGIRDTQCGAKIFKKEAITEILPEIKVSNMAFDVNLLFLLKKTKKNLEEVAIDWQDDKESSLTGKVHIISFFMLYSIFRLRIVYSPFKGIYKKIILPFDKWLWIKVFKQNWENWEDL